MSDRILGGVGLALAIFYAWAASIIPEPFSSDPVGPPGFPYVIAILLGLSSIYFLVKPDAEPDWPSLGRLAELGVALAAMFLYAWALPVAGFLISTAIITAYLAWRLGSHLVEAVLTGIGTSVGLYVIFGLVFGLSLAEGPLGF